MTLFSEKLIVFIFFNNIQIIESKEINLDDIKKPKTQIEPNQKTLQKKGQIVNVSHFFLVDLAGSERASKTLATNDTLKEGAHINKSLLTLSTGFYFFFFWLIK